MRAKRNAFAGYKEWAPRLRAAVAVVDAIAVADPEVSLGAEHPDRLLQEAGEKRWAVGTELAGVDAPRRLLDDAGTTTRPIARRSIRVLGAETAQRARSVQPIVHQRVDGHHTGAGGDPALPGRISAKQEVGKRGSKFAMSVSSSSVTNRTPLVDPGRWRTSTSPATATRRPSRVV